VVKACDGALKIINEKLGKRILGNSPEFSIVIGPRDGTL
jgi:hypothetical protein